MSEQITTTKHGQAGRGSTDSLSVSACAATKRRARMENTERIELIEQAQELIEEAKALVDAAVEGTPEENHYNAYGCYGFKMLSGSGNPYDSSLYSLIETFGKEGRRE